MVCELGFGLVKPHSAAFRDKAVAIEAWRPKGQKPRSVWRPARSSDRSGDDGSETPYELVWVLTCPGL